MLVLLDTHILLALAKRESSRLPAFVQDALRDERNAMFASVVSLWEIAIKCRLGKLASPCPLEQWPRALSAMAVSLMDIAASHALGDADPVPDTNDPFDRLLLAICEAEKMRFVTLDRSLIGHPLALRPASA
ncbi:MAG TPA: type II toxin-antitoxin system VapC family toxin [Allosphingosinicella sp.]|jgi:PIN domain nuclease of toxin-antitoxin system|nr:type II toxin-antitoxin system VapC family toxin [Allosphingosinicella sp.]